MQMQPRCLRMLSSREPSNPIFDPVFSSSAKFWLESRVEVALIFINKSIKRSQEHMLFV